MVDRVFRTCDAASWIRATLALLFIAALAASGSEVPFPIAAKLDAYPPRLNTAIKARRTFRAGLVRAGLRRRTAAA